MSAYHREHAVAVRPALTTRAYDNTGFKQEQSGFVKVAYELRDVRLLADVQLRRAAFRYEPSRDAGITAASVAWSFANPRVGATWRLRGARAARPGQSAPLLTVSASYGTSSREPSRGDLLAGADDLNSGNAASLLPLTRVHPENVRDLEVGLAWNRAGVDVGVNAFAMQFRDEIAPIGALSLTGSPLRQNVPSSRRNGVEVDGEWRVLPALTIGGNVTLMDARIGLYADASSGITRRNVEPLLTPHVIGNAAAELRIASSLTLHAGGRYVGASFLGNDSDARFTLPAAWLADAALTWRAGAVLLRVQVDNALNANAHAGGYHDGQSRYFYPVATRSYLLTSTFTF